MLWYPEHITDDRSRVVTGYIMRRHWGETYDGESRNQLFSLFEYWAERILGRMDVTPVSLDVSCNYRRGQSITTPPVAPQEPVHVIKCSPFGIGIHFHRAPGVRRLGRTGGLRFLGFHADTGQRTPLGPVPRLENPPMESEIVVERHGVLKQILVLQSLVRRHGGAQFTE